LFSTIHNPGVYQYRDVSKNWEIMILKSIKKAVRNTQDAITKWLGKIDQKQFGEKEFVIISNNCWGAEIYKRLNKEYNTPFVGLFIVGPEYIRLLERFDHYMSLPLQFTKGSVWFDSPIKYPIGKLDDIEIHFVHYKNNEEAIDKWTRRLSRMKEIGDRDKYYIKICDRDFTTPEMIQKFHSLPFKNKISFSVKPFNSKNIL
jgi:uncharacterized protein (DUF1919 family)